MQLQIWSQHISFPRQMGHPVLQRWWRMSKFRAVSIREKTTVPPRESKTVKSVVSTIGKTVSTEGPRRGRPGPLPRPKMVRWNRVHAAGRGIHMTFPADVSHRLTDIVQCHNLRCFFKTRLIIEGRIHRDLAF